jgi:CBS domain-containing protein
MKCEDVMLTLIFKAGLTSTVAECAQLMRDEELGFLPVLDEEFRVVGVVTDRDLAVRIVAEQRPATTLVTEVMSPGPFLSCEPEDELEELEQRMAREKKARALVKAPDGSLLGVISLSDIAQAERSAERTGRLLKEVTRRGPVALVQQ